MLRMDYISRFPAPPPDVYIDDLYYLEGVSPYPRLKVHPGPSLQLMVNLGPAFDVSGSHAGAPVATCSESWWIGLWSTFYTVDWREPVRLYGVHFKPGGVYPFLNLPAIELHNQVVALDATWGRAAAELRERLAEAPNVQAGLGVLECFLLARLTATLPDVVHFALAQIARRHGGLSIRALSDDLGISQNHLGNQFKAMVGSTPKQLARFSRFAHVVLSIDPLEPVDWTSVAHQAGYYDLSHFDRESIALTGHNPTDYLRLRRRFRSENPGHALDVGPLPTD